MKLFVAPLLGGLIGMTFAACKAPDASVGGMKDGARESATAGFEERSSAMKVVVGTPPATSRPSEAGSTPKQSRNGMAFEDDPWGATNHAEQRWLDAHGFPNAEQHAAYFGASDGILWQAAQSGDPVAQVLYDARRLPQTQALDRLLLAGADGNLFALQSAASFYAGSTQGNVVTGYAIARVAEMRGDTSLAIGREMMFRTPLTVEQRMQGEVEALKLSRTLDALYEKKTGQAYRPEMRPAASN